MKVTFAGMTGKIKLEKNGERHNFTLDIVKVKDKPVYKVWQQRTYCKIIAEYFEIH